MGVDGVVVVEIPQRREVAAIDGAAVGVHQLPQRKLVEHFLTAGPQWSAFPQRNRRCWTSR